MQEISCVHSGHSGHFGHKNSQSTANERSLVGKSSTDSFSCCIKLPKFILCTAGLTRFVTISSIVCNIVVSSSSKNAGHELIDGLHISITSAINVWSDLGYRKVSYLLVYVPNSQNCRCVISDTILGSLTIAELGVVESGTGVCGGNEVLA